MRLLMLLAVLGAGAWLAPQLVEETAAPCPALEQRVAALVKAEAGRLPGGLSADPRLAGLLGMVQSAVNASGGAIAQAYVRDRFAQLPPDLGCVAAWWKLKLDPDLGPYVAGLLKR